MTAEDYKFSVPTRVKNNGTGGSFYWSYFSTSSTGTTDIGWRIIILHDNGNCVVIGSSATLNTKGAHSQVDGWVTAHCILDCDEYKQAFEEKIKSTDPKDMDEDVMRQRFKDFINKETTLGGK